VSLEALRRHLSTNQRAILNAIWKFDNKRRFVPASALYGEFTKDNVEAAVESLGGSIVFRTFNMDTGRRYYHLTFLGTLLTDQGYETEKMLVRYLEYVQSRLKADSGLNGINSKELETAFGWSEEQADSFRDNMTPGPFWNGGKHEANEYILYLPRNADDLIAVSNMHDYVEEIVLEKYDPNTPVNYKEQYQQSWGPGKVEPAGEASQILALSKTQLWILALGFYVLYFFYTLFLSVKVKGAFELRDPNIWGQALTYTLWLLPIVLALLLLASVLGVERFFKLLNRVSIVSKVRRTFFFAPAEMSEIEQPMMNGRSSAGENNKEIVEEADFGDKFYRDFQQTVRRVYNNAILQYGISFYFSLIFSVIGFGLIFYALVYKSGANPNWPAVVVSAVIESVPALFFYLSDRSRKQMTEVFVDLRRDNEVARAYGVLKTMRDENKQESLKEEIIRKVLLAPEQNLPSQVYKETEGSRTPKV